MDRLRAAARGALVAACEEPGSCARCGQAMVVQKTLLRRVVTLALGELRVRETVHVCRARCGAPARRAAALRRCVPPGATFGYDVLVHVGLARFLHHRQRDEIRTELRERHAVVLSCGQVSHLARRFLELLAALHLARAPALRAALAADGGWPLHVDATGEDGRGTLLVVWSGWRAWALGAFKIPSERADAVLPRLREVVARFGEPCAVMRDLGRAMIPATAALVDSFERAVPILACHLHFLADVGEGLLEDAHRALRERFRKAKVLPALRALARDLARRLGRDVEAARSALLAWQTADVSRHRVPEGTSGLGVVRGFVQWVLDYAADSRCGRFPFDRPYLDIFERCRAAGRALDAFERHPPADPAVRRALGRLRRAIAGILEDAEAAALATTLRARAALLDELRDLLRLRVDGRTPPAGDVLDPERAAAELRDVQRDLTRFEVELRARRPSRGPAQDTRRAIDVVLVHLERHGENLFGHAVAQPPEVGGGIRLVDRTNNALESFFHALKHGERRRSGRKCLTQDFERMPPEAALVPNLARPDYVRLLCASLEKLPTALAEIDAARRRAAPPAETGADDVSDGDDAPLVSVSLQTADRNAVRTEAMTERIRRAARSRAPKIKRVAG